MRWEAWCSEAWGPQTSRRGAWGGDGAGQAARMALGTGTTEAGRGVSWGGGHDQRQTVLRTQATWELRKGPLDSAARKPLLPLARSVSVRMEVWLQQTEQWESKERHWLWSNGEKKDGNLGGIQLERGFVGLGFVGVFCLFFLFLNTGEDMMYVSTYRKNGVSFQRRCKRQEPKWRYSGGWSWREDTLRRWEGKRMAVETGKGERTKTKVSDGIWGHRSTLLVKPFPFPSGKIRCSWIIGRCQPLRGRQTGLEHRQGKERILGSWGWAGKPWHSSSNAE